MKKIPFSAFRQKVRELAFPKGEPENLVVPHDQMILAALVDLQENVPCLQANNVTVNRQCATMFSCGKTILELPHGVIRRVFTIANDDWCDRVYLRMTRLGEVESWSRNLLTYTSPTNPTTLPKLPFGFRYATAATDSPYGRSRNGIFCIHNNRIIVAPWIQSNESVVVEWDGQKKEWGDADLIWDDPVLFEAVQYWLMGKDYLVHHRDAENGTLMMGLYNDVRSRLMYECRERTRLRELQDVPGNTDSRVPDREPTVEEVDDDEIPTDDGTIVFANIGDFGNPSNGTAEEDVANLVKSWVPDFILTNGDNIYAPAADYDEAVGRFYGDYITDDLTTNRFWPAFGNHDWNDGGGSAGFTSYFRLPNNGRYYDFVKGVVHFFVCSSDDQEPDGNTETSKQAVWLRAKMLLSTAKWKVVIIQDPPYTSEADDTPGITRSRWPFKDWGASVVLSGDSHLYERLEVDGLPYIVNGAGGAGIHSFGTPLAESLFRHAGYGAILCTASCDEFKMEFITPDDEVLDTLTLT